MYVIYFWVFNCYKFKQINARENVHAKKNFMYVDTTDKSDFYYETILIVGLHLNLPAAELV